MTPSRTDAGDGDAARGARRASRRRRLALTAAVCVALVAALLAAGVPDGGGTHIDPCGPKRTAPAVSGDPEWHADFESGGLEEWSWWGKGDPRYTGISVVDPTAAEPRAPRRSGRMVGRFALTPRDIAADRVHSKLYQYFSVSTPEGARSPDDVSGTYRASFFLPRDYSIPRGTFVTAFQFKEQFLDERGATRQDPTWLIAFKRASDMGVSGSRRDAPVAVVQHWRDWEIDHAPHPGPRPALPLGRWFELRADLTDGGCIAFYLDGEPIGGGTDAHYPVGPAAGSRSLLWIFGIGNYADVPGVIYADAANFHPGR